MSDNVIELFISSGPRVIVDGGELVETAHLSAAGEIKVKHKPGTRHYFVDTVDDEGVTPMWDGASFETAMAIARECADELGGAPIIQRVRS